MESSSTLEKLTSLQNICRVYLLGLTGLLGHAWLLCGTAVQCYTWYNMEYGVAECGSTAR